MPAGLPRFAPTELARFSPWRPGFQPARELCRRKKAEEESGYNSGFLEARMPCHQPVPVVSGMIGRWEVR